MSDGERALRGSFALFDLVPGVGYLSKVAKSGSKLAAKEFLQATLKEGFEQGVRNVDNVVKLANKVGDKVMGQVDNFGKQLANVTNKTVVSGAEHLSSGLKAVDSQLSDMAQNFRLNVNLEPQFVSGVTPTSSSQIDTLTSKLDDFVSLNKADMAASSADASKSFSLNGNLETGYSAGSGLADDVAKSASVLGKIQDIEIKKFEIKNKHLNSSTAKRARKFNVSSAEEANKIVQDALKNGKIIETIPNGVGSQGQNSFSSIIDIGKVIGTKGETHIKIVYDELKNVWTTYPVPKP
ncbi:hypothetical protein [Granulicatella seriolae]|uniref:Pre-toxin TG domain-containing protein n=1 Tax=Granulicatella seriolae TaxID=2967226 RepID=A0ABT1WNN3_9LACT|nr:hypothetical protein [Granulicatella seriolae]